MEVSRKGTVRFAAFEFDLDAGVLYLQGRRVPLQDQPARLLALLVGRPGELVTRDEARAAIWSDLTFVDFDTSLNVAINKLRRALRDSATAPRFIETIAKRGYRFTADVHVVDDADMPGAPPADAASSVAGSPRRLAATAAAIGALVILSSGSQWPWARPGAATPRAVAVLPFKPLVTAEADEALQTGIAADVIVRLGRIEGIVVSPFDSVRRFGALGTDSLAAGRTLGVDAVLEGYMQRDGEQLKVNAQLRRVRDGTTLWAESWQTSWTQIFSVQDSIARRIVEGLEGSISPDRLRSTPPLRTSNPDAYRLMLEGRHHVWQRRSPRDARRAVALFEQAIALDANYAEAWAGLAMARTSLATLGASAPADTMPQAKEAALAALRLDATVAEAYRALGLVKALFELDVAGAGTAYRQAMALEPNDATHAGAAALYESTLGRTAEALELNRRQLALDPASVLGNRNKALILYAARRYDECIEQSRHTLELDPHFVTVYGWLARAHEQKGEMDQAFNAFVQPLTWGEGTRALLEEYREAYKSAGWKGYWRARLDRALAVQAKGLYMSPYEMASAHLRLGEKEQALNWLEKAYEERSAYLSLLLHADWDPLRSDPRFERMSAHLKPEA